MFNSNILEVLLFDCLLLNSPSLLLENKSLFFLLYFSQLVLNVRVINLAILIGLNLLEKQSLLSKFILTCSLCSRSSWDVVLGGNV